MTRRRWNWRLLIAAFAAEWVAGVIVGQAHFAWWVIWLEIGGAVALVLLAVSWVADLIAESYARGAADEARAMLESMREEERKAHRRHARARRDADAIREEWRE